MNAQSHANSIEASPAAHRVGVERTGSSAADRTALGAAMDRYARGDDAAFEQVYRLLVPRLAAMLSARGCGHALIEDLLQQTFLHIHQSRSRYECGRDLVPWAAAIARRLLIDHWRKRRRDAAAQSTRLVMQEPADPEAQAIAAQTSRRLTSAFLHLPGAQRDAVELVKMQGLSLAQAARLLDTSVTGIKLRQHRALVSLRAAVADDIAV